MDMFYRWAETSLLVLGFALGVATVMLSGYPAHPISGAAPSGWLPTLDVVADSD